MYTMTIKHEADTYTVNIPLTSMTASQFKVDPHSSLSRRIKPKNMYTQRAFGNGVIIQEGWCVHRIVDDFFSTVPGFIFNMCMIAQ